MITLPFLFSQLDSRWCNHELGSNTSPQYNIYNYGCLLCCLAMILEYYGLDTDPLRLNQALLDNNAFEPNSGIYKWGSLNSIFPGISDAVTKTPAKLTDDQMNTIKSSLDAGKPVILQIDYNPKVVTPTMHFVVAIAYDPNDENNFTIADPLGGKVHSLKDYLGFFHPSSRDTIEAFALTDGTVPQFTSATTIPINKVIFPQLVHGSEQWDKTVAKYLTGSDPKITQFEDFDKVIGGIRSRATDFSKQLDNQKGDLAAAQQSVINLGEQLAESEKQRQADKTMYLAQIDKLKANGMNIDQTSKIYEGRITELQDKITSLLKEKHDVSVQHARLQAQATIGFFQKYTPTFFSWVNRFNSKTK